MLKLIVSNDLPEFNAYTVRRNRGLYEVKRGRKIFARFGAWQDAQALCEALEEQDTFDRPMPTLAYSKPLDVVERFFSREASKARRQKAEKRKKQAEERNERTLSRMK